MAYVCSDIEIEEDVCLNVPFNIESRKRREL